MAECFVCKGEYTPGEPCPRCKADNKPWEAWQKQHPEEQGGWEGLLKFTQPHIYLPFLMTTIAFGCSLLGLGGVWKGVQPGFQIIAVLLTVGGCLLSLQATYEARHAIREQMLLAPLLRGRRELMKNPRTRAVLVPALTVFLAFLLVVGMVFSPLLRELLCWLVFEPNYCKEEPVGLRDRVTEALPLILMLCTSGFLVAFSYSSSLLLAMKYANTMRQHLPLPIFLDEKRLARVVRRAAEQILSRPDGRTAQIIGTAEIEDAPATSPTTRQTGNLSSRRRWRKLQYCQHWNWGDMERTPDGGIRMKAFCVENLLPDGSSSFTPPEHTHYIVIADPWGRIRRIQREEKRQ